MLSHGGSLNPFANESYDFFFYEKGKSFIFCYVT